MPHMTLEYSTNVGLNIDGTKLFTELHAQLAQAGDFRIQDFKSRVFPIEAFYVGLTNDNASFVRLNIETFIGKSLQQKKALSCVALEVLSEHFHEALAHENCDIAVQITELEKETYARIRSADLVEKA